MSDKTHPKQDKLSMVQGDLSDLLLGSRIRNDGIDLSALVVPAEDEEFRVHNKIFSSRNVNAVGIGQRIVNGCLTDERCVTLFVDDLYSFKNGNRDETIKTIENSLRKVYDVPIAVVESPIAQISACCTTRRTQQRPVSPGISVGHTNVSAGTIAGFCRSTSGRDRLFHWFHKGDHVYVLSNNHVLGDTNRASAGDKLLQPGPADGGLPHCSHFASFHRAVKIHVGGKKPNRVDAAIGRLLTVGVGHKLDICKIGSVAGTITASEQMTVCKHGRTTGYTEGSVSSTIYSAIVAMNAAGTQFARFNNQIRIEKVPAFQSFAKGGDSGSLVVEQVHSGTTVPARAVGLYFAGPPDGSYGLANHIDNVIKELKILLI